MHIRGWCWHWPTFGAACSLMCCLWGPCLFLSNEVSAHWRCLRARAGCLLSHRQCVLLRRRPWHALPSCFLGLVSEMRVLLIRQPCEDCKFETSCPSRSKPVRIVPNGRQSVQKNVVDPSLDCSVRISRQGLCSSPLLVCARVGCLLSHRLCVLVRDEPWHALRTPLCFCESCGSLGGSASLQLFVSRIPISEFSTFGFVVIVRSLQIRT